MLVSTVLVSAIVISTILVFQYQFRQNLQFRPMLRIRSLWVTWIRIRENTGSGSFIHKKKPCNSKDQRIQILIFKTGSVDPDPESKKNGPDPQHWTFDNINFDNSNVENIRFDNNINYVLFQQPYFSRQHPFLVLKRKNVTVV